MGEVKHYESQIRDLRQKIIEYESNMTLLTNEVQRLSIVITDKNSEIEVLKGKINTLERTKEQELQELRQKFELEQRVILEKELRDIAEKFARERAEWDIKHRDMRQKIIDYENKFTYLSVEVERLNALYEEKLKEAESWKQRYMNLEHSKFSELEQVRVQIESLKRNSMVKILSLFVFNICNSNLLIMKSDSKQRRQLLKLKSCNISIKLLNWKLLLSM